MGIKPQIKENITKVESSKLMTTFIKPKVLEESQNNESKTLNSATKQTTKSLLKRILRNKPRRQFQKRRRWRPRVHLSRWRSTFNSNTKTKVTATTTISAFKYFKA